MRTQTKRFLLSLLFALLAFPRDAMADMVWPALYLESRLLFVQVVGLSLLIEWPVVKRVTCSSPAKSFKITLLSNCISAVAGVPMVPAFGLLIASCCVPGKAFTPFVWTASCLGAAFVTFSVEMFVLKRYGFQKTKLNYFLFFLVNCATVAAAMATFLVPSYELRDVVH